MAKRDADALIIRLHYSHKTVNNAFLALGVFLNGRLEDAMTFGPSMERATFKGWSARRRGTVFSS
ncbi:Mom family adenine methylcarbamoylation protein [Bradyrhizobium sp. CCBAU 53380]|uniref:Mom family adenine methylcarbamoylation protein n=1 Tax=Bradyrhizobium sp. CCBAU 53380 TaxID=1325117 RepID=UPI003FA48E5C